MIKVMVAQYQPENALDYMEDCQKLIGKEIKKRVFDPVERDTEIHEILDSLGERIEALENPEPYPDPLFNVEDIPDDKLLKTGTTSCDSSQTHTLTQEEE